MFYFIVVWSILGVICLTIGTGILNFCQADCFQRQGDRAIASIWLGVVTLAVIFLAVSFILPLSTVVGLAVALVLVTIALIPTNNRQEIIRYQANIKIYPVLIYLIVVILVSALTTQQITWFDSGMYHWVSIKWLAEFGTVPGVALITSKLGFNASWFAFTAPLHALFLGSHIGAISNGFIFSIAIFHCLIAIKHLYQKDLQLSDSLVLANSAFIITTYTITPLFGSAILISFTPDIPVNLTVCITAWMLLTIVTESAKVNHLSQLPLFNMRLIPLIVATATVTMKLSALPLLAIAFLFSLNIDFNNLQNNLGKVPHWLLASLISIVMLMPMFGYGIVTSGCPLYPSQVMCLELPWSIDTATVSEETTQITGIKASESDQDSLRPILKNRWKWLKISVKLQILVTLIMLSVILAIWLQKRAKSPSENQENLWVIGLGISGMLFITIQSPLLRFGLGYFILIPALFLGKILCIYLSQNNRIKLLPSLISEKNFKLGVIIIGSFAIAVIGHSITQSRFLIPAQLPKTEVIKARINDVNYVYPANWNLRCWNTELPCAMLPIKDNIRLRNPERGIGAGFIYTNQ